MSRTSHRGGGGVDGLASVHENDGGSNTDDSDDESDSVGKSCLWHLVGLGHKTRLIFPEPKTERDELINPYWIEDKDLKRGEVDYLSGPEIQFWKDLLDKYLYPIDENKEQQVRVCFFVVSCVALSFNDLFLYFFALGSYCCWFDWATKQVRLFLLHVQCPFHFDRVLAAIEQRSLARWLATWCQDQHYLHRRNLWSTWQEFISV